MNYEQYRKRYREDKTGFSFWLDNVEDADIIAFLKGETSRGMRTETIKDALRKLMKRRAKK